GGVGRGWGAGAGDGGERGEGREGARPLGRTGPPPVHSATRRSRRFVSRRAKKIEGGRTPRSAVSGPGGEGRVGSFPRTPPSPRSNRPRAGTRRREPGRKAPPIVRRAACFTPSAGREKRSWG